MTVLVFRAPASFSKKRIRQWCPEQQCGDAQRKKHDQAQRRIVIETIVGVEVSPVPALPDPVRWQCVVAELAAIFAVRVGGFCLSLVRWGHLRIARSARLPASRAAAKALRRRRPR
jgi:hypothetical protein